MFYVVWVFILTPAINWKVFNHYCFKCFFCSVFSFFSFRYYNYINVIPFVIVPQFLKVLFLVFCCCCFFFVIVFNLGKFLLINIQAQWFFPSVSSLLMSPFTAFFTLIKMFLISSHFHSSTYITSFCTLPTFPLEPLITVVLNSLPKFLNLWHHLSLVLMFALCFQTFLFCLLHFICRHFFVESWTSVRWQSWGK